MWIYDYLQIQVKIHWIDGARGKLTCAYFIIHTAVLITSKFEIVKFFFLSYTLQLFFNFFIFYALWSTEIKGSSFNLIQKLIVHILPVSLVLGLQVLCLKQYNCGYSKYIPFRGCMYFKTHFAQAGHRVPFCYQYVMIASLS